MDKTPAPANRLPTAAIASAIKFLAENSKEAQGVAIDNSQMKAAQKRNTTGGGILSSRKWVLSMNNSITDRLMERPSQLND